MSDTPQYADGPYIIEGSIRPMHGATWRNASMLETLNDGSRWILDESLECWLEQGATLTPLIPAPTVIGIMDRIASLEAQLATVPVAEIQWALNYYMDIGDHDEHTDKIFAWLDSLEVRGE